MMTTLLTVLLCAILGAYVGKFMAITTHFLPTILLEGCEEGREPADIFKWFLQKPFCWQCQAPVPWKEYVPFAGYWIAKGQHSPCQHTIDKYVPILECGIAILFGLTSLLVPFGPELVFVWIASCLLICCFITDFEHQILPDQITLTLVWVGLIGSLYPIFITTHEAIIGAVFGYAVFFGFNWVYRFFRGFEGIYPGDFKLNAGIGACVGWKFLFMILLAAMTLLVVVTFCQALYARKNAAEFLYGEVPYACFAATVAAIALFMLLLGVLPESLLH
ncbi:MAG: A24 family peptidase [Chlamydiales bacterium]|nr:A24 family peptidase [Chlamydiales bacterium]